MAHRGATFWVSSMLLQYSLLSAYALRQAKTRLLQLYLFIEENGNQIFVRPWINISDV